MNRFIAFILTSLFIIQISKGQTNRNDSIVTRSFGTKSELYFSFPLQSTEIMNQLTRIISIDNVRNNQVIAVASKKGFSLFLEHEIPFELLPSPFETVPPEAYSPENMTDYINLKSINNWDAYPTYQAYLDLMAEFRTNYPTLCRIDTIGYSVQGRLLLSAVISDNVNTDEYEPEFLYTSTIHGDEITGYVLMLRLIDYLLTNYGSISEITNLVNNAEIYINPNANPDGTYYAGNTSNIITGSRRFNYNNIDLNRNYPVPDGSPYGDGPRQIETQYFMDWAAQHDFVVSANFHGGAELMNYPWDYSLINHPDQAWWIFVCTEYAQSAQNNSPAGYYDDFYNGFDSPGVTEGATWYVALGTRQDYMQNFASCREVTNEISETKNPVASSLPDFWNYNYQALILYMKQVLYGFKGIVSDACTNQPIKAKIELVGHDGQNSYVFSSLPVGNYHRPVKSGTYSMKASASGYSDLQFNNLTITDYNSVIRDFQLTPNPPAVEFSAPNTFTCSGIAEFQNLSVAPQDVQFTWYFGDGTTSNDINPVHTYTTSGTFSVKLIAESCAGTDSVTKISYIDVYIPSAPVTADQGRCGSGVLTFTATSPGIIYWWDQTGNNLLAEGSTFTTPFLTQTTQYVVSSYDELPPCYGGKTDNSGNGSFNSSNTEHGLIFTAHTPVTITSAVVYAQNPATLTFKLTDSANNTISTVSQNVPAGQSSVQLNFNVPEGTGYKLLAPVFSGLFANLESSNIGYPFSVCNLITITSSTDNANPENSYFYFYNIEVEEQPVIYGGLTNKTSNGQYYTNTVQHGLIFNCYEEVILKSVKVYSNQASNRTITLRDASDNIIADTTLFIANSEQRVQLNFTLPDQDGLKLSGPASPYLWRDGGTNAPDLPYPFAVGDIISITGNTANNEKYYYFFYDWEIEKQSGCNSPQIPVTAYIYDTPEADFSSVINVYDVHFQNQSYGGGFYTWDFGDGQFSSEENPVHTYSGNGDYTVILTLTNDCGTDAMTKQITLTSQPEFDSNAKASVYPNPFTDNLIVNSPEEIRQIKMFTLQGTEVFSREMKDKISLVSLQHLTQGVYILQVITDNNSFPVMVVKQ